MWPSWRRDDVDRDPLPGELDGVGMAELMRREPSPDPSLAGELAQLRSGGGRRPRPAARDPVDHAEQRTDRRLDPMLQPPSEMLESPLAHPRLAALVPLTVPDPQRPTPARPRRSHTASALLRSAVRRAPDRDQRPQARTVTVIAGLAHHEDDLFRPQRIRRVAHPLVRRRASARIAGRVAGERRRPAASNNPELVIALLLERSATGPSRPQPSDPPAQHGRAID